MKKDIEKARDILSDSDYTCVFVRGDEVITSTKRGVVPLLELIDTGRDFSSFSAADKVVGKGAALLYILLGVTCLHGEIMSTKAAEVLESRGVTFTYGMLAEYIINRKGDGICPMEMATLSIDNPQEGYEAIVETLSKLKN